jgi:hypothetical protein
MKSFLSRAILQNGATAIGAGTPMDVAGYDWAAFQVYGMPLNANTIMWEATVDDTHWVAVNGVPITSTSGGSSTDTDGVYRVACSGLSQIRANITTYGSGTVTVTGIAV